MSIFFSHCYFMGTHDFLKSVWATTATRQIYIHEPRKTNYNEVHPDCIGVLLVIF